MNSETLKHFPGSAVISALLDGQFQGMGEPFMTHLQSVPSKRKGYYLNMLKRRILCTTKTKMYDFSVSFIQMGRIMKYILKKKPKNS